MKKLVALTILAILALAPAADAKPKKLPYGEAVLQARIKMADWVIDRDLSYPKITSCQRKSRIKYRCSGIAKLDEERFTRRCDLVAVVTNRYRRLNYSGYWEAATRLVKTRCKDTPKLYLEGSRARNGVLLAAEQSNRTNAEISYLFRQDNVTFEGAIDWTNGSEICDEDVSIKLGADNKLTATFSNRICF